MAPLKISLACHRLLSLTCICYPNRKSPAVPQIGYLLVPLNSYTCCCFHPELPLLPSLVDSSSSPRPSPRVTSSQKPSLILLLSSPLMRLGHLSSSTASVLAYFWDWTHHTVMSSKPGPSTMEGVGHSSMNECSTDRCQVSNPQL